MDIDFFVQKVKSLCKQKGITPTSACEESGAGRNFMDNIKKGSIPSVAKVQMLAEYLGVTTSELLGEEKEPAPTSTSDDGFDKSRVMAAFLGGDQSLTQEEQDALWEDVYEYARFKAEQWAKRKREEK